MLTTKLSSKGQVIIPKAMRSRHHWESGQELAAVDVGDGILLRAASPFPETTIKEVASCLPYRGRAKTLKDMEKAISKGARESAHGRS